MNNQTAFDLVAECDNLAREGKTIQVSWNGGSDEGQFDVQKLTMMKLMRTTPYTSRW